MLKQIQKKSVLKKKRAVRIRRKLRGSAEKPRLCVFKSHKHIGAQVIDDASGKTLLSYSTLSKDATEKKKSKEGARLVGQKLAELAKKKKIEKVIFDRGRFKYHGLIAELASAAREHGLKF